LIYPYSQANRLEEPHSYMYTPFQGAALLQSYLAGRVEFMHRCSGNAGGLDAELAACALPELERLFEACSHAGGERFRALAGEWDAQACRQGDAAHDSLERLARALGRQTTTGEVTTLALLQELIATQLIDAGNAGIKVWLDRLVQRFEVTKKLYDSYPPGFRKGEGANTSVRLYWLFALALSLFYARTGWIKYLSTLLKACDLLCSLPNGALQEHIPERGLAMVFAAEVASVQLLAESKGVTFAAE